MTWGKLADLVENYMGNGKEIAIRGKLTSRSYETQSGENRYVTEILVNEILFLGNSENNESISK